MKYIKNYLLFALFSYSFNTYTSMESDTESDSDGERPGIILGIPEDSIPENIKPQLKGEGLQTWKIQDLLEEFEKLQEQYPKQKIKIPELLPVSEHNFKLPRELIKQLITDNIENISEELNTEFKENNFELSENFIKALMEETAKVLRNLLENLKSDKVEFVLSEDLIEFVENNFISINEEEKRQKIKEDIIEYIEQFITNLEEKGFKLPEDLIEKLRKENFKLPKDLRNFLITKEIEVYLKNKESLIIPYKTVPLYAQIFANYAIKLMISLAQIYYENKQPEKALKHYLNILNILERFYEVIINPQTDHNLYIQMPGNPKKEFFKITLKEQDIAEKIFEILSKIYKAHISIYECYKTLNNNPEIVKWSFKIFKFFEENMKPICERQIFNTYNEEYIKMIINNVEILYKLLKIIDNNKIDFDNMPKLIKFFNFFKDPRTLEIVFDHYPNTELIPMMENLFLTYFDKNIKAKEKLLEKTFSEDLLKEIIEYMKLFIQYKHDHFNKTLKLKFENHGPDFNFIEFIVQTKKEDQNKLESYESLLRKLEDPIETRIEDPIEKKIEENRK